MRKIIVNSTPIISLCSIGRIELLKNMYEKIYIPYGVYEEVCIEGSSKVGANLIEKNSFIIINKIQNEEAKRFFKTSLHKGEVEVMILAEEMKADLCIIDDLLARKYAKYLGLQVTGTLGILLKAKEYGLIKEVKPYLNDLISNGIYISEKIYDSVTNLAGE